MIGTWLARIRRIDDLSLEVGTLRRRVEEAETQVRIEAERTATTDAMASIVNRLAAIHDTTLASHRLAVSDVAMLEGLTARIAAIEERLDTDATASAKELASLRSQILTLERQFRLHERDYADTVRTLAEGIASLRRAALAEQRPEP